MSEKEDGEEPVSNIILQTSGVWAAPLTEPSQPRGPRDVVLPPRD